MIREWPWTHTVFFVLHGLVMLMKQHSYAFYNGHLSTVYRHRQFVLQNLKQLESVEVISGPAEAGPSVSTISTSHLDAVPSAEVRRHSLSNTEGTTKPDIERISKAVASSEPLSDAQLHVFERIMKWEVAALTDELKGTAHDISKAYPANLSFINHFAWIPLPTVVYEIQYPKSDTISWPYVLEKLVAMVGVIFVMIQVSEYSICKALLEQILPLRAGMSCADDF